MPKTTLKTLRGLSYPADAETLRAVKKAGGLSKMSEEDRRAALANYKYVPAGGDVSDMPNGLQKTTMIERHEIIIVSTKKKTAAGGGS